MVNKLKQFIITVALTLLSPLAFAFGTCNGHYLNPITDVCWSCLLPISIGSIPVTTGALPDTLNPPSPLGVCPVGLLWRVGLNIGYWEPFAVTDVTPTPFCMVNMAGIQMDMGFDLGQGSREMLGLNGGFYWVHWYNYPLISWMGLITSAGCLQAGDFELGYFAELDPTWSDDELAGILTPEAVLFSNPIAQASCAADSLATAVVTGATGLPLDSLFWCAGSQGSMYPLSGHIGRVTSPMQAAVLLSERMDYKLHREGLVWDSNAIDPCHEYLSATMPKSRYRYQLTNTIADASHCYPFGHTTLDWEALNLNPAEANHFGFLIFRKRNCTYL